MEFENFGKLLRWLRKQEGLTQSEVTMLTDIAQCRVSKYERDVICPAKYIANELYDLYRENIKRYKLHNIFWELWFKRGDKLKQKNIPFFKRKTA